MTTQVRDLFEEVLEFPDPTAQRRYAELVGLDDVKDRLEKEAAVLLNPKLLREWSERHHGGMLAAVTHFEERGPFVIFAGDVGTGKTTLAETFGDPVARANRLAVRTLRLSLRSRGSGAVGEMTKLLSDAFDYVAQQTPKGGNSATILVIDEADALAQSRTLAQMHHEDRAGVNAIIRGVDQVAAKQLPVLIVMCTNRLDAIDAAIRRRAAAEFLFRRPNNEQRAVLFRNALGGTGFSDDDIAHLVALTSDNGCGYGYTHSDIVQRIIPAALLAAYPDRPLTTDIIAEQIEQLPPTKPFDRELA